MCQLSKTFHPRLMKAEASFRGAVAPKEKEKKRKKKEKKKKERKKKEGNYE